MPCFFCFPRARAHRHLPLIRPRSHPRDAAQTRTHAHTQALKRPGHIPPSPSAQIDIYTGTVAERSTLTFTAARSAKAPVSSLALCWPAALAAKRVFLEVRENGEEFLCVAAADEEKTKRAFKNPPAHALSPPPPPPTHTTTQVTEGPADADGAPKLAKSPLSPDAVAALGGADADAACVGVTLPTPLAPGAHTTLSAAAIHARALTPLPAARSQADPVRLAFNASHTLVSPYPVANQTLVVDLPCTSAGLLAATPRSPQADDGEGVLSFGPYFDTPAFTPSPLFLHFTDDNPAPVAASLTRDVLVSHWGNVAIDEAFDLANGGVAGDGTGPLLAGQWSRYEFDVSPRSSGPGSALTALTGTLPRSARWIYFRDVIGNISSSSVRPGRARLDVRLEPRFPLVPGWRATFRFGYSLPLRAVAAKDVNSGRIRLTVPLGTPLQGVSADLLATTVVLPEGAGDIQADTPFGAEVVAISKGVRATTLDTVGRPTVTATVRGAVAEHMAAPLVVSYTLSPLRPFVEPFMLVAAFGACFGVAMVARRTDVSLGGGGKKQE
jgi:oligosaccharyltransferase complex subunit alpha (ribophorin I)